MRLVRLRVKNFRCYQAETNLYIDDLTALIGKNDIGKSSLLEALDAFFNDNIEEDDLSKNADNSTIEITCFFEDVLSEIILDSSAVTSPQDEGILNMENHLEIKRTFSYGGKKSASTFLNAYVNANPKLENLLSLKNDSLKSFAENNNISLKEVSKTKNPELRAKIREHFGGERILKEIKVEGNLNTEDNLKTIWSSLKKLLPVFSLFKADREMGDKDGSIQDPMKVAINEALAMPDIVSLLEEVERRVQQKSSEVAERTIQKMKEIDESIAEKLESAFNKEPTYNKIFDLKLLNENGIPLNKRGSGVRRLVLLSFFQARAEERKANENAPSIIYAIEEPETSQHPNHQRLLIKSLIQLSRREGIQVLFSSHSSNLVREMPIKSLRVLTKEGSENVTIEYGVDSSTNRENNAVIERAIDSLGVLPNPKDQVKVLLFVEGVHDVEALKRYSHILHSENPDILDLSQSREVAFVITVGSSLKQYVKQKYLSGLGKPEVHIYDSDVEEYRKLVAGINKENNPRKKAFNTNKKELENYLHHEAIIEVYSQNGTKVTLPKIEDDMDVPQIVAENLYRQGGGNWDSIDKDLKKKHASAKKELLNSRAVEKMNVKRIKERGGYKEICRWLNTISEMIKLWDSIPSKESSNNKTVERKVRVRRVKQ